MRVITNLFCLVIATLQAGSGSPLDPIKLESVDSYWDPPVLHIHFYDSSQTTLTGDTINFSHEQTIRYICNQGFWIGYTGATYNYGGGSINVFYRNELCAQPLPHPPFTLGSARPAGILSEPGASFFSDDSFRGDRGSYLNGSGVASFGWVKSFVLTHTNLQLFPEENYNGNSICLLLMNDCFEGIYCWVWDLDKLNLPFSPKSALIGIGCGSNANMHIAHSKVLAASSPYEGRVEHSQESPALAFY